MNIKLNINKDILMIDLSYYIFYRYYSTYNWLKKYLKLDINVSNILEDPVFIDKYPKLFERTLCDLVKASKTSWNNVFLVKDCLRENIWRNEFISNYKGTRDDKLDTFNKDIFKYTYGVLIPELQAKYNFNIENHERLEADDVIALMTQEIRKNNSETKITIITNDNDYIQLIDDNTIVKNLQGKELKTRINVTPELYLKIKIISGDKSDNIPSIMKKVGIKTSEKLASDDDTFNSFCIKNPCALEQYKLNKLLIDFNQIPKQISDCFRERIIIICD